MAKSKAVILTGPTGSGKSSLALACAKALKAEIVNADSLAFYKGLDIGAAKPTLKERALAPHHLFDVLEPDEDFDAAAYLALARPIVERLNAAGRPALVVGGTGLYIRSLTQGLFPGPGRREDIRAELRELAKSGVSVHDLLAKEDPLAASYINPNDYVRVERALEVFRSTGQSVVDFWAGHRFSDRPFETLTLILDRPIEELDRDLRLRAERMFSGGLLAETKALLDRGFSRDLKPFKAIGYKEAAACLFGEMTEVEAVERVYIRTRRLAKRQRTWFRGQTPEGLWIRPDPELAIRLIRDFAACP